MRLINKIKTTLKRTSGASLIFVLGVMMFLMAIGVSTLAAAFANAGYVMRQSEFTRVRLLHESIHENIMYSLQADPEDEDLLGYQIAMAIFNANDPAHPAFVLPPPTTPENLNPTNPGLAPIPNLEINVIGTPLENLGGRVTVERITLSFPDQFVRINEAIPGDDTITPAIPREPRTATLNASMIVEVVIRIDRLATDIIDDDDLGVRRITSIAVYEYTGGRFTEEPAGVPGGEPGDDNGDENGYETFVMKFESPSGYGIWRMVRHEIIDW